MFRLSKYELRKNRTALFVLLAGLAALQICFLIALRGKTQDYAIIWSTILVLYAVVCYFAVFIFAITNYYREINQDKLSCVYDACERSFHNIVKDADCSCAWSDTCGSAWCTGWA